MTHQNLFQPKPIHFSSLIRSMLIGGAIGLIAISFFVFGVDNPHPSWPKFWYIRPLIVTPIVGAMGGAFYFFITHQLNHPGWVKVFGVLIGIFGFIVALWMGTILGLVGTMWN